MIKSNQDWKNQRRKRFRTERTITGGVRIYLLEPTEVMQETNGLFTARIDKLSDPPACTLCELGHPVQPR